MTFFHPNHSIMQTETMDNIIDRDKLQDAYIRDLIYGMDEKSMEAFVYDTMNDNLDKYSVDELIEEVEEYDPDMMEESKEN
tara:strand:- start:186 stop:428 length:243 start_codon:yes stop_codon:yes gene_type:complete